MLLNTLLKLCTVVTSVLDTAVWSFSLSGFQAAKSSCSGAEIPLWTTVKTTGLRWEAELMQQVLAAHEVPARIIDLGIESYMGQGSPAALQVHVDNEQLAIRLLSVVDETAEAPD